MRRLVPLLLLATSLPALAQVPPKIGRHWHEDAVRNGFRFKPPRDWTFFPADVGQPNVLGRYVPERQSRVNLGGGEFYEPKLWILIFDEDYEEGRKDLGRHQEDLESWIEANPNEVGTKFEVEDEEEHEFEDDLRALEREFLGTGRATKELRLWSMTYDLTDRKRIALLAHAPAGRRDWGKWRSTIHRMSRSFQRMELEGLDVSGVEGGGVRARKHRELLAEVSANPGWELHPTENYFVITNSEDQDFVDEVIRRIEAIRERFEADFPREKAMRAMEVVRKSMDEEEPPPGAPRTVTMDANPAELARCSVVRICNDRGDYQKYGGPPGSAGYWWTLSEELVLYDDQEVGGRRNTWATLQHEAFHQFIYYFFSQLSPGTWYNEGTADYYAGFELTRRGRYEVGRRASRNSQIKEEIRQGRNVPLKTLIGMSQAEYYAREPVENPRTDKPEQFSRYPHGWSFVYFLRTGEEERAKGWENEYGDILDVYLDTLIETRDIEKANEAAFAGIDWEELEEAWERYIVKG